MAPLAPPQGGHRPLHILKEGRTFNGVMARQYSGSVQSTGSSATCTPRSQNSTRGKQSKLASAMHCSLLSTTLLPLWGQFSYLACSAWCVRQSRRRALLPGWTLLQEQVDVLVLRSLPSCNCYTGLDSVLQFKARSGHSKSLLCDSCHVRWLLRSHVLSESRALLPN
jgi:hypothetical protein